MDDGFWRVWVLFEDVRLSGGTDHLGDDPWAFDGPQLPPSHDFCRRSYGTVRWRVFHFAFVCGDLAGIGIDAVKPDTCLAAVPRLLTLADRLPQMEFLMTVNFSIKKLFSILNTSLVLIGTALVCQSANASETSCITAGRLNADGNWSPQFQSVRLLDDTGRNLSVKLKSELMSVRSVELLEPALLSGCDGDRVLTRGNDVITDKAPVPAAKSGRYKVIGLGFPKLQIGGELVELKVQLNAEQIVMMTR